MLECCGQTVQTLFTRLVRGREGSAVVNKSFPLLRSGKLELVSLPQYRSLKKTAPPARGMQLWIRSLAGTHQSFRRREPPYPILVANM